MKFKTTRKEIVNGYSKILCIGYCDLSTLLKFEEPRAYTSGVYGWNFDLYVVEGVAICTGYRNMPGRKANNVREYEQRAREIENKYMLVDYDKQKSEITALLHEFINQA